MSLNKVFLCLIDKESTMQELADKQWPLYKCIDIQKIKEIVPVRTLQEKFNHLNTNNFAKPVIAFYGERSITHEFMS